MEIFNTKEDHFDKDIYKLPVPSTIFRKKMSTNLNNSL